MLEAELKLYISIKDTLPVGSYVLIRGEQLVGSYETEIQALTEGARRFGRGPFLVRQVRASEPVISNPALSLGILHAVPAS